MEFVFGNYNKHYIKSPLNYTGGKYKLLPQMLPLFPKQIDTFVDMFCGGGNVSVNVKANKIIANDINTRIIDILKTFKNTNIDELLNEITVIIDKYKLSKTNKEGFLSLRNDYNKSVDKPPIELFVIICYSFNYQFEFNSKGEFNMSFGMNKSSFNGSIKKNLIEFANASHNIQYISNDFRNLDLSNLTENDFVYCDPPYLITDTTYGRHNFAWTEIEDKNLYNLLDTLNNQGVKFALSNVLSIGEKKNDYLIEWSKRYNIHYLNIDYSNCCYQKRDKESKSDEVLITNYKC